MSAFQQVKPAPLHFGDEPGAADLLFDPRHRAADHAAARHCLGRKDLIQPTIGL